jgi:hypothetical protein
LYRYATGTLTLNAMDLRAVHVTAPGASPHDLLVAAALATRWTEPAKDAIDAMVVGLCTLDQSS